MKEELIISKKQYKGEDGYKIFSIRIKEKTVMRLDDLASTSERSRNELINTLIEYALDHCVVR